MSVDLNLAPAKLDLDEAEKNLKEAIARADGWIALAAKLEAFGGPLVEWHELSSAQATVAKFTSQPEETPV